MTGSGLTPAQVFGCGFCCPQSSQTDGPPGIGGRVLELTPAGSDLAGTPIHHRSPPVNRTPLDPQAIQRALQELNQGTATAWSVTDGKLHKVFVFKDFVQAFGFMASVALVAESLNHHPEWSNVYNRVTVDLRTHDADGITELDFTLAQRLDGLVG